MKIWNYMLMCVVVLCTSCASSKKVVYLQDVVPLKQQDIEQKYEVYVHNDDLLAIMVNSKNPELALPFNMPMVSYQLGSGATNSGSQRVLGYLVDGNGDIDFPILGKLHVAGLTRMQLTEMIKQRLIEGDLIKDPIVTVQFLNYKVSVMCEVNRPGSFNISGDRITLLEALSMAGDLTIYGRRARGAVIRYRVCRTEQGEGRADGYQPEQIVGCLVWRDFRFGFHRVSDCDINKVKKENL